MAPNDPQYGQSPQVIERIVMAGPPRRGLLSRLLGSLLYLFLFVLCSFVILALGLGALSAAFEGADTQVTEHYHSLSKTATDKIAIITVDGAILDGEGFIKKQIDHVHDDPHVRAIVLRVNSPGGTVTASDYLYHHLRKMVEARKIPIVVSMGGLAASGGYYIAMAVGPEEKVIFAEPTTWTGSIGVIIPHYNVAGLMKHWEVEEDSIKSGPLKQMGTPTRPMTTEEKEIFKELVDDSFQRFQNIVKAGRPAFAKDPEALAKVTTGQVFTADQAVANGLVDEQGYIEEAIARATSLAGLSEPNVRVVKYKQRANLLSMPFNAEARSPWNVAAMLDLATPRAYFLCNWQLPLTATE
ncbi:MAG TPA: signal peptide peptidase SppA [Pirellulales bacterium]|jgi:protease-4